MINMISKDDIKEVLKEYSGDALDDIYVKRHQKWKTENQEVIASFFKELNYSSFCPEASLSLPDEFSFFLATYKLFYDNNVVSQIEQTLKKYNYNPYCELILMMKRLDGFWQDEYSIKYLQTFLTSYSTFLSFNLNNHKCEITTTKGSTIIMPATKVLNIRKIAGEERKDKYHHLTSAVLRKFSNLYGAYYMIPYPFLWGYEHSVVIDKTNGLVYDLANNTAIPLEFFQKYYPHCIFEISSEEFKELNSYTQQEFNLYLSMEKIETIRRIRKKQE